MPRHKTAFTIGLEKVLNNPDASFLTKPQVFKEIGSQSGMSITDIMRHIGKRHQTGKRKEPTQKEKSEERLEQFKAGCEK